MERFNSFSSDQIILTKRQTSMIMASMLLFCLFVFIVGFFLGKRTVIEDYSEKVSKEALHDQIDFLLTTQSLQLSQEDGFVDNNASEAAVCDKAPLRADVAVSIDQELVIPDIISQDRIIVSDGSMHENRVKSLMHEDSLAETPSNDITNHHGQYAQLIGFGTKKAAQAFVLRLKKHNVPVILKTIMSKTAAGKPRVWYQAITPTYELAQDLQEQIAKVKRLEHIRDIDIKIVHIK